MILCLLLTVGPYVIHQYKYLPLIDPYYCLATHQANILVIGSSRAKRGIVPSILKKEILQDGIPLNISINGLNSPYGESYFNFIQKKVKRNRKGLFILDVSPPSIMQRDFEINSKPREFDFFLYQLNILNLNPNIEYLLRANANREEKANSKNLDYETIYHSSGWWEAIINDNNKLAKGNYEKIPMYRSLEREVYLKKTIEFLKDYGRVILVRMPVSKYGYIAEEKWHPNFDKWMVRLSENYKVEFLNYSQQYDLYNFYDDKSHMDGGDAKSFTKVLANDILQGKNKKTDESRNELKQKNE